MASSSLAASYASGSRQRASPSRRSPRDEYGSGDEGMASSTSSSAPTRLRAGRGGRGRPPLPPGEAEARRRERNRVAAIAARKKKKAVINDTSAELDEKKELVEMLERQVRNLQSYVQKLKSSLSLHGIDIPAGPYEGVISPRRELRRTRSPRSSPMETVVDTSQPTENGHAQPEAAPVIRQRRGTSPRQAPVPTPPAIQAYQQQPTPQAQPDKRRSPDATPRGSSHHSTPRYTAPEPYVSPRYGGPGTPVSYVRDTDVFTPVDVPTAALATEASFNVDASAIASAPLQPDMEITASTLEALQLQLQLFEQAHNEMYGKPMPIFPVVGETPTNVGEDFTGGDDYDTMSLSAFFNLDALEDDPEDANFEPTSPTKLDSSDDESDFEEEEPARKRARTEAFREAIRHRSASPEKDDEDEDEVEDEETDIEEEDLFLPIEDVPVPPPRQPSVDQLYSGAMADLGVRNRRELGVMIGKIAANINRGASNTTDLTPEQMDALRRLLKIAQAQGIASE